ncbi:MAG: hypothetical protein ACXVPQ_05860 [Bacteroidia bacterium]
MQTIVFHFYLKLGAFDGTGLAGFYTFFAMFFLMPCAFISTFFANGHAEPAQLFCAGSSQAKHLGSSVHMIAHSMFILAQLGMSWPSFLSASAQ